MNFGFIMTFVMQCIFVKANKQFQFVVMCRTHLKYDAGGLPHARGEASAPPDEHGDGHHDQESGQEEARGWAGDGIPEVREHESHP